jgi:signal transduction histidine kinase
VIEPGVLALDADPMLIERVVANLVDNALRHGVGMSVRVEAGAVADRVESGSPPTAQAYVPLTLTRTRWHPTAPTMPR